MFHVANRSERAELDRRHRHDRLPHLAVIGDLREEEAEDQRPRRRATARPASTATATTASSARRLARPSPPSCRAERLATDVDRGEEEPGEHGAGRAPVARRPTSSTRRPAGCRPRPARRRRPAPATASAPDHHRSSPRQASENSSMATMSITNAATAELLWIISWIVCGASGRSTSNTPAAIEADAGQAEQHRERSRHAVVVDRRPQPDAEAPARRPRRRRRRCSSPGRASRWRSGSSPRATGRRRSARRA